MIIVAGVIGFGVGAIVMLVFCLTYPWFLFKSAQDIIDYGEGLKRL